MQKLSTQNHQSKETLQTRSNLQGMPNEKKTKTVGFKRIEQLKGKIEDPLNLN
jgi:anti-sigma28 factor (negative regulator of flagellin synthesis)